MNEKWDGLQCRTEYAKPSPEARLITQPPRLHVHPPPPLLLSPCALYKKKCHWVIELFAEQSSAIFHSEATYYKSKQTLYATWMINEIEYLHVNAHGKLVGPRVQHAIRFTPRIVYLGLIPGDINQKKDIYLFQSKKAITRSGMKSDPPTPRQWGWNIFNRKMYFLTKD